MTIVVQLKIARNQEAIKEENTLRGSFTSSEICSRKRGDVTVCKIKSEDNLADPFTKTLSSRVFEGYLEGLGIRDMSRLSKWEIVRISAM